MMATKPKATTILTKDDAERFLRQIEENESAPKVDFSEQSDKTDKILNKAKLTKVHPAVIERNRSKAWKYLFL